MSASSSGDRPPVVPRIAALLALAHAGWIWWLSSQSIGGGGGPLWGFLGNSFHFVLFGVLALLIAEALRQPDGGLSRTRVLVVVLLTLAYGVTDELHQSFTPERSCDLGDVWVDLLGALGATSLWWGVRGPGRFGPAVLRLFAFGATAAAFNAWRAWGPPGRR